MLRFAHHLLFACMPIAKVFHSYRDVSIAGEVLKILTYTRHSWPLTCEGSLAGHTVCATAHPIISEDP